MSVNPELNHDETPFFDDESGVWGCWNIFKRNNIYQNTFLYYNTIGNILTVSAEVYFTADVTEPLTINVLLSENDLISQQSGGSAHYLHKHTFREAFTNQWGDDFPGGTIAGSY